MNNWQNPETSPGVFAGWRLLDANGKVVNTLTIDPANLCYRDKDGRNVGRDFDQARKRVEEGVPVEEGAQTRLTL